MSTLLYWNPELSPEGPYDIAAVRFSSLVSVEHIRIVPAGGSPFLNDPAILGRTRPDSFRLQVYMNVNFPPDAQPSGPPNALGATSLAYTGEDLEYDVILHPKAGTRLMVFQGKFQQMSIAIYGRQLSEPSSMVAPSARWSAPEQSELSSVPINDPAAYAKEALNHSTGDIPSIEEVFQSIGYPSSAATMERAPKLWPLTADDPGVFIEVADALRTDFGASGGREQRLTGPIEAAVYITLATLLAVCEWAETQRENDSLAYALLSIRRCLLDSESRMDLARLFDDLPKTTPLLVSCLQSPHLKVSTSARAVFRFLIAEPSFVAAWSDLLPDDLDPGITPPWTHNIPENDLPAAFEHAVDDMAKQFPSPDPLPHDQMSVLSVLARKMESLPFNEDSEMDGTLFGSGSSRSSVAYSAIDVLQRTSETLEHSIKNPSASSQPLREQAMALAKDYFRLLTRMLSHLRLVHRTVRQVSALAFTLHVWESALSSTGAKGPPPPVTVSRIIGAASDLLNRLFELLVDTGAELSEPLATLFDTSSLLGCETLIEPHLSNTCVLELLILIISTPSEAYEVQLLQGLLKILPDLSRCITSSNPELSTRTAINLIQLDHDRVGMAEWLVQNEVAAAVRATALLTTPPDEMEDLSETRLLLFTHAIDQSFDRFHSLLESSEHERIVAALAKGPRELATLETSFGAMNDQGVITLPSVNLARALSAEPGLARRRKLPHAALVLLQSTRLPNPPFPMSESLKVSLDVFEAASTESGWNADLSLVMRKEVGHVLESLSNHPPSDVADVAQTIVAFLDFIKSLSKSDLISLPGVSESCFDRLVNLVDPVLPPASRNLSSFKSQMEWSDYVPDSPPVLSSWRDPVMASTAALEAILGREETRPSTPTQPSTPPNILGMAALSPFNMVRSPTAHMTSLSKTYSANDFRSHRTSPNVNTSRPPSMHVDDFQTGGSTTLPPSTLSQWSSNAM